MCDGTAASKSGSEIGLFYDPMLAKLIVHAPTRDAAVARMHRALLELTIEGVESSRDFHLRVMEDAEFKAGAIEIQWLERRLDSIVHAPAPAATARAAALVGALIADRDRRALRQTPSAGTARVDDLTSRRLGAGRAPRGTAVTLAELDIESIAAGGDGVGRSNGVVVFVPRTAPGDRIRANIDVRGRFARGEIDALVRPSSDRVTPECAHYVADKCGGCQLQHVNYDAQLDAKRRIIRDSLARIGKRAVDLPAIEPSPRRWRYRRKLTLTMRRVGEGRPATTGRSDCARTTTPTGSSR